MLEELISNQVLLVPIYAWVTAQLLKVFTILVKERRLDLRYLIKSGGMPSAHSAMVSALATAAAIIYGLESAVFGIAAILALIVIYDAVGVRQSVGQHSVVLNRLIKEFRFNRPISEWEHDLRELMGHTTFQIFAGVAIGIIVALIILS